MASALVDMLRTPARPEQLEVTQTETLLGPNWVTPGHPVPNTELDVDQLQADLAQALGRDVSVRGRAAPEGGSGVLHVLDAKTGHPLTVDSELVASVLAAHEVRETEEDQFAREFDEAGDEAAQLGAYRAHIQRQRDERARGRFLAQRTRDKLAAADVRLSGPAAVNMPRPTPPPPVTSRNPWNRRRSR